jgi:hypothetical protein
VADGLRGREGGGKGVFVGGGGLRERERERAPVSFQRLSSPATPWMLMDDWPYSDHLEPAVLQATFGTQLLRDGNRNSTFALAAKAGSFTGGAAAAQALVGILGTCRRSSAV